MKNSNETLNIFSTSSSEMAARKRRQQEAAALRRSSSMPQQQPVEGQDIFVLRSKDPYVED